MYEFFKNNQEGNYIRVSLDNKELLKKHFNSKGYYKFNESFHTDPEHEQLIMYFDETDSYIFCKESSYEEAIKTWTEYPAEQFIGNQHELKRKLKLVLRTRLKSLFDNPDLCFVADTANEKLRLLALLNHLKFKPCNGDDEIYLNQECFINPNNVIYTFDGTWDELKDTKTKMYRIVNFKDILKEIDLEDLKQLKL